MLSEVFGRYLTMTIMIVNLDGPVVSRLVCALSLATLALPGVRHEHVSSLLLVEAVDDALGSIVE